MTPARESESRTGTQSAVTTARANRGVVVTIASASSTLGPGPSTSTTRSECTWFIQRTPSVPRPVAAARRRRFWATAAGSSPT
jgi:hypothetical protein